MHTEAAADDVAVDNRELQSRLWAKLERRNETVASHATNNDRDSKREDMTSAISAGWRVLSNSHALQSRGQIPSQNVRTVEFG